MAKKKQKARQKKSAPVQIERREPLGKRGVAFVSLSVDDGRYYSVLLSRVPCNGEEVGVEGELFLVRRVQHSSLDEDGRAFAGYLAYLEVTAIPDE
ncbi:MAG: hypothetical protein RIK87_23455 [Fuerstiella sp.]